MMGLEQMRARLLDELTHAEMGDFQVVLDAGALTGADVDQVVKTLGPIQRTIDSVGQALDFEATRAGVIAGAIRSQTRLRLVGTFPGSFGLALEGPAPGDEQFSLFDNEDDDAAPLLERSIAKVLDVIEAASEDDPEQAIVEHVADLGSRVTSAFMELAEGVSRMEGRTRLVWRAPDAVHDRVVSFSPTMATELRTILQATTTNEREVEVSGILEAADKLSRTFKIVTDDGELVRGKVDPDLIDRLRDYFDQPVHATVSARTSRSTLGGKEATSYTLVRFAGPLDPPSLAGNDGD
jgi:hypothetical protein